MKKWLVRGQWSEGGDEIETLDKAWSKTINEGYDNVDGSLKCPDATGGLKKVEQRESVESSEAPQVNGSAAKEKSCHHLIQDVDKPATGPQVLAGVTVAATHLGVGCVFGFCGVALPQLTQHPAPGNITMNDFHLALFSSVISIGAAVGSAATAVPQVWLGQRVTLLFALPVALAAWVTLAASPNVWVVIAARAVQGLTVGFIAGPSNNYVAELAHSNLRGLLVGTLNTSEQLGYLLVYAVGSSSLSWRQVALVCGFLTTVLPFLGLLLLPDSPRWLAARHRLLDAHKALIFFRGPHYDSHAELVEITDQLALGKRNARDQLQEMKDPNIISVILLFTFLLLSSQFTGNFLVTTFEVPICNSTVTDLSPATGAAVTGTIRFLGSVAYLLIVERVGRKSLLIGAFLACAGALAMLGSFHYDHNNSDDVTILDWLPFISLSVFIFSTTVGFSVLYVLLGELFPTSVRSTAVAFLYSLFFTGAFVASQTYVSVVGSLGKHGAFWLYCCFNLLMAVVGGLNLPETRRRSLEDITAREPRQSTKHSYDHHRSTKPTLHANGTTRHANGHLTSKPPPQHYHMTTRRVPEDNKPNHPAHNFCKSTQTANSSL
ncbi:facilitated trehalose transporter Tret1-like [Homarus americanus]|uniref:Facilitated trehalose transporter Tret1-like 22 n=1 Tax=Homarus americanus TaxID=6706 RepID=A0A8J5JLJ6_HOMAM|nr:facilitated trehalose transporter Tret1-like [Homarus americanus]KAG7155409.1 Facilitated trehalose transporter Tret1-like 22 [Homarus americanus]